MGSNAQAMLGIAVLGAVALLLAAGQLTRPADAQGTCTEQTVTVGIVEAKGCFTQTGSVYKATAEVELNGFKLTPSSQAPLTVDRGNRHVTTEGKQIGLAAGGFQFVDTALDFNVPSSGTLPLLEATLTKSTAAAITQVLVMPVIEGAVPISLTPEGGRIDISVGIGELFRLKTGKELSTTVGLEVEPGKGIVFDGVKVNVGEFKIGSFELKEFEAEFSLSEKEWGGKVEIAFPPDGRGVDIGFKVKDQKLVEVEVGVTDINLELVDGVFLQKLIGMLNFDGRIAARLDTELSAGPEIDVFGRKVTAVAVDGDIEFDTGGASSSGFFGVGGDVELVTIPLAELNFKIYFSGGVSFGASFGTGFPKFTNDAGQAFYLGGKLDGWIKGGKYQFDGSAELKAFFVVLAQGEGVISDKGAAVCGTFFNHPSGGGAYSFEDNKVHLFAPFFCGIGDYKESMPARAELAADGSTRIDLGRGHNFIRLDGANGEVPAFRLEGPGGRTIEHPPLAKLTKEAGSHVVASNPDEGRAHIVLARPRGSWKLTELEDGPAIVSVARAGRLPEPAIEAEVRGRGPKRTLVWKAKRIPHQRLQFNEVTPDGVTHPILRTSRHSGRFRFRPLDGDHYGVRKLEVGFQQRFSQRDTEIADRYRVTRPSRPGRPQITRAERLVHDTAVHWRKARGARRYQIVLASPDNGFRFVRRVGPGKRHHVFRRVPDAEGTRVEVRALNRDGVAGRAASRRVAFSGAVANLRTAARRTLETLRIRRSSDLTFRTPCPAGGECRTTITVRSGGRRVAKARARRITAGTAGRLQLPVSNADRRRILGTGLRARIRVEVEQLGKRAKRSQSATLRRSRGDRRR